MNFLKGLFYKFGLLAKKHAPTIISGASGVAVVYGTYEACKATLKLEETIQPELDELNFLKNGTCDYEDKKKDIIKVYVRMGKKIVKLYLPAILLIGGGITGFATANIILHNRLVQLGAAYTALETAFLNYRSRVAERYGDDLDKELMTGGEHQEVTITDENGNHITTDAYVVEDEDFKKKHSLSIHARQITKDSWMYDDNPDYVEANVAQVAATANDWLKKSKLGKYGYVHLFNLYDRMNLKGSDIATSKGWFDDPEGDGDNCVIIDFYKIFNKVSQELEYWVDFNVDPGNLNEKLMSKNLWSKA